MATVSLRNIKKIYPNTESKGKKKKDEASPEEKVNLQITDEGVVAVQAFNLEIADKEFIVLVGPSGCGKSTPCAWSPVWRTSPPASSTSTTST